MNLDFTHTKISFKRPLTDYDKVRSLIGFALRGSKRQLRKLDKSITYLNAGCGPNPLPDFINLDYRWIPGLNLCWDLTNPLPFENGAIDGIYCEHCIEHFSRDDAAEILREFRRILKTGASLRIVVPDAELYIRLYIKRTAKTSSFPTLTNPKLISLQLFR